MLIDLRTADIDALVSAVFDHDVAVDNGEQWYQGHIAFAVDPNRQLRLLAALFAEPRVLRTNFAGAQVEQGLWCMMSSIHHDSFTGLVWNPILPLANRTTLIESVYELYNNLLAAYPYDAVDFQAPDATDRRFETIDYMAPDLLLQAPWFPDEDAQDKATIRGIFLELFARLLQHDAPVAQYAALHGLGHLHHPRRSAIIDGYLARCSWLEPDQRRYAECARVGDVL